MEGWAQVYCGFERRDLPDVSAKEKWVRLFVAVQGGELRCSLSQQSAWPIAIFYLAGADIATAAKEGTRLIQLMLKEDVYVWMILESPEEEDQWLFALTEQMDGSTLLPVHELNKAAIGLKQYLEDVVNEAMPAVGIMEVTLAGDVHRLPVTLDDNVKFVSEQFSKEHKLKPSVANTLELELLRTQVDASKEKIASLREANKRLRVSSMETSTLRQKVAQADIRIHELEGELAAVEEAVPKLDALLDEYLDQNNALQLECNEVNERLQEAQETFEHDTQANEQRWKQQLESSEAQVHVLQDEIQELTRKLESAKVAARKAPESAPRYSSTAEEMYTPQPNGRQPNFDVKTDRFAPATGTSSPAMPPNTAPARILSRAERRTLWTPLTAGVTTARMTENMSPSKLTETNKELKAKLRTSKQLSAQYADKLSALQQTAKSFELTAQDAGREVQRLKSIIHQLRDSMEHRSLLKLQEENKLLKQQMVEMKGELVRVKRSLEASQSQGTHSHRQQNFPAPREQQLSPRLPTTTPISETTVKALPLTLSVQSHVLRVIFDKYATNQVMTRFKFQQFTREYDIISETDLIAGDVDVLFASILRTTQTNKAVLPKQPMRPVGPYKPGTTEPQHNLIDVKQFESLLSALALRLYLPLIEKSSQTQFYLLEDHEHDAATNAAVEILYKEKLIPVADRAGLIRWAAIYIAETKAAYLENELLVEQVSNKAAILLKIFSHYTDKSEQATSEAGSLAQTDDMTLDCMTFRALSQFAHDFGICPILVEVARLYELYAELDGEGSHNPQKPDSPPSSTKVSWVHSNTTLPTEPNRLNYSQWLALLAVIAHQYFPDSDPTLRMNELLRWMDKSGGFHVIQQHDVNLANSNNSNSNNPFA